ncbi:MAG: RsmB/NOP family class I SAM-dependent RNA methyltransferase [Spirochaetes bacterium]|nr:RsmB/NOP family class I SAM-dependent RNA methyltransferase [Spirochaetota bacterium]
MNKKNYNKNIQLSAVFKNIENLFTPSQFNKIITAYNSKRKTTFRINLLKINRIELIKQLKAENIKFNNINFIKDAFYLESDDKKLLNSSLYKEGFIYLQSISSMMPAVVLSPKKSEKILDIAASPGSKTTQMAGIMNNTGKIDAVEPDFIRMERLKYNCSLQGVKNVNFYHTKGEKFYISRENHYDKALVDAPCSGEGIISANDKNPIKNYSGKNILRLSNLQFKLLKSAIISVKIGGTIVYSTCTLNNFENEEVIDKILNDRDIKVSIEPINDFFNMEEKIEPFIKAGNIIYNSQIRKSLRLLPSQRMEGFFICKLRRFK